MKILFSIIVSTLLAFGSIFPSEARTDSGKDIIRVLILEHFPPQFISTPDGPSGLGVDVMREVARRLSLNIEFVTVKTWPDAFASLEARTVDVMANMGISKARQKLVDFTHPYEVFEIRLFVRMETIDLKSLGDLKGRVLGLQETNVLTKNLIQSGKYRIKQYPTYRAAFLGLLSGEIDAIPAPTEPFLRIARAAGLDNRIQPVGPTLQEVKRAMAVPKGRTELRDLLNKGLDEFKRTDRYQALLTKWYGTPTPYWTAAKVSMAMAAILVVSLLIMAGWRYNSIVRLTRNIQESEERYALVIAGTNDGVWERNYLTGRVFRSPRWFQILGYEEDEIDPDFMAFEALIHPEDFERYKITLQAHLEIGAPFDVEFRIRRRSGDYIWVGAKGQAAWDEDAKPIRMAGSIKDITGCKLAEDAIREKAEQVTRLADNLRHLIDGANAPIIAVNRNGQITEWNEAAAQITGHTKEEVLYCNLVNEFVPEEFRESVNVVLDKAVQGEATSNFEFRILAKGSTQARLLFSANPQRDEDGRIVGVIGVGQDITTLKQTEEVLHQAQKLEAVGQLTGGISHDFNNLLGIILGNAELLAEEFEDDKKVQKYLDPVLSATQRGAELTHRLLAFSRKQSLHPKSIQLGPLCDGMNCLLKRSLGETIEIDITADNEPWSVLADPSQVENALLNLAINASHAMPDGGKLAIAVENARVTNQEWAEHWEGRSGEYVALAVTDTGTGMPASVLERVFEPFFTTKVVGQGSGLGLSMVYGFAQQSGGFATIESEEGTGTTVTIYLPRVDVVDENIKPEAMAPNMPKGQGETILVVEDEPDLRRLTVRQLEHLGYKTLQSANGPTALEILAKSDEIDLLLSDVVLPGGISGPQIYEEARELRPDLKCLLMSGYASPQNGMMLEGVYLLNKPFEMKELAGRVNSTLSVDTAIWTSTPLDERNGDRP